MFVFLRTEHDDDDVDDDDDAMFAFNIAFVIFAISSSLDFEEDEVR